MPFPPSIQEHDVVSFFLDVVGHHLGTALAECLYDLSRLRASAAMNHSPTSPAGTSAVAAHFPRRAVGDKHAGFLRLWSGGGLILRGERNSDRRYQRN
jgi:hypothetical protein